MTFFFFKQPSTALYASVTFIFRASVRSLKEPMGAESQHEV